MQALHAQWWYLNAINERMTSPIQFVHKSVSKFPHLNTFILAFFLHVLCFLWIIHTQTSTQTKIINILGANKSLVQPLFMHCQKFHQISHNDNSYFHSLKSNTSPESTDSMLIPSSLNNPNLSMRQITSNRMIYIASNVNLHIQPAHKTMLTTVVTYLVVEFPRNSQMTFRCFWLFSKVSSSPIHVEGSCMYVELSSLFIGAADAPVCAGLCCRWHFCSYLYASNIKCSLLFNNVNSFIHIVIGIHYL